MTQGPHTDPRSDRELLGAHVDGDLAAFELLVRRHQDQLWGLALRTLAHRDDAADALQDALLKAHRSAAGFRGEAAVTTWLHRIVVNTCLDRIRRDLRRPADATEPDRLEEQRVAATAALVGQTRGDSLGDAVALRLDVETALSTLAPEQRASLVLVDVLGYDLETAAEILDCPVGTVKSRCSRGRARLAPLLAHLGNPGAARTVEPPGPAHIDRPPVAVEPDAVPGPGPGPEGGEQL